MRRCAPNSPPPSGWSSSIADRPGVRPARADQVGGRAPRGGRALVPALLALLIAGAARAAEPEPCPEYAPRAERTGRVPAPLAELSGLAASRLHRGVFWAHNDSGNAPVLRAMRANGTIVATCPLRGVRVRDLEDIAVGPCSAGGADSCIYLGDIGDNGRRRKNAQLLKVREPAQLRDQPLLPVTLPFRYADGPRDAEALLVDPRSARVFVVAKSLLSLGDVYRIEQLGARDGGTAVRVRTLRPPRQYDAATTGGDAHPSGTRLILRTYTGAWELRSPNARSFEDVLEAEPVAVPDAAQPQGEAISYTADGRGYLLGGERAGSPLYRVHCATD